jgi:DNA repair protein RecO (recombination protein O)
MAIHYRTEGFILRKNDLREADQVFTVFTKDFGKIKILARAIRKIKSKLRSGADLFYLSGLEFIQGKAYKTLTDATALNKFRDIKRDLNKLGTIQQIADSLDNLVHEEEDKDIWNLLNEALGRLNDYQLIYHYFLWNLFSILGYQINLYHCVVCQKRLSPSKLYFSPDQGGILCSDCSDRAEEKEEVSPNVIKTLRLLLKKDWDTLSRLKIPDSEKEQLELISELNLRSLAP